MPATTGPQIEPLEESECEGLGQSFATLERLVGFLPNSQLTMARMPRSTAALIDAMEAFYGTATLPRELLNHVAMISNATAGSEYGVAQNAATAERLGLSMEKVSALSNFETSFLFDLAERVALSFAVNASQTPNAVKKSDVEELLEHFTETQVVEITSVVGLCGLFARFNDSVAVAIEPESLEVANTYLSRKGLKTNVADGD